MSECVEVIFEKPIKKKRSLPEEFWGDRILHWIPFGNDAAIARELGVASIASFISDTSECSEDYGRARQAFGPLPGNPPDRLDLWFDAVAGLETSRALLKFAQEFPERVEGPEHWGAHAAENFIPDLESLEQTLKVAEKEVVRFRLRP